MSLTKHLGFGHFQLRDFAPGELFARYDGSLALVCNPQPEGSEQIAVWLDYGTSNARRALLHQTALVYAITSEQAWTIEHRRKEHPNGLPRLG
jgi:hypothetical protein